jgi:hypothetical protein
MREYTPEELAAWALYGDPYARDVVVLKFLQARIAKAVKDGMEQAVRLERQRVQNNLIKATRDAEDI